MTSVRRNLKLRGMNFKNSRKNISLLRSEVKEIGKKCENISGVVFNWKNTRGKEGERTLVYGTDLIVAEVMGKKFEVSPDSFFQTHYHQCAKLYNELGTLGTKYCQKDKIRISQK
jgi:tRNA/tmRNA/rRNA uracil-C5-methylase (TrmA/RlmC/RlmD family)